MDGEAFVEAVRSDRETPLDRLGSERALVAVTGAAIDRETVLARGLAAEARAVTTFESWATDEDDAAARSAFEDAASLERDHRERIRSLDGTGRLDDAEHSEPHSVEPDALHEYLRELDDTIDRVGAGLVGRPLVASRTLLQVINFFVNEGDTAAAECFRDFRRETDEQATAGGTLLVELAADDETRERGKAGAGRAVDVAYEEYVEQLSAMGVDPKPVC